ncbi:hypothetical protein OE903_23180 [Bacillus sp. B6(2022)]|nr:hypothetical protein [Bacillus sp. B6(2022)]
MLKAKGKDDIYHVLSFGGGTQSAHLLEDHLQGKIHYDFIVFSDTGAEPEFIHKQVEWWQRRQKSLGNTTPFIVTHHKSMHGGLEEMLWRYIETDYQRFQMPLYFSKIDDEGNETPAGITPRQCTIDFKIIPVKQAVRNRIMDKYGLEPRQRFPSNVAIVQDIGFSFDELNRVSMWRSPQYKYVYMTYPLVEQGLTTKDSIEFLAANGFPEKRSRCYLCPFNCSSDRGIGMDWEEIIQEEPLSFLKACYFDSRLRELLSRGEKRLTSIPYFHYSRTPLKDVFSDEYESVVLTHGCELKEWKARWSELIEKNTKVWFRNPKRREDYS